MMRAIRMTMADLPKTVQKALAEWANVFRQLPRIDAVFVPGGDPGHTDPRVLLPFLEQQTANLHRYHPHAEMWVSPQSFNQEWLDSFYDYLKTKEPSWLSGVVYGPQVRVSLPEMRAAIPKKYPIRRYPDITHSIQCQFPVQDWDTAYAMTESREVINPRPVAESEIFRAWRTRGDRLHLVFRGLQRRRQQVRVERAWLGPGSARGRDAPRVRPLFHQR